jgi:hypothetical protein
MLKSISVNLKSNKTEGQLLRPAAAPKWRSSPLQLEALKIGRRIFHAGWSGREGEYEPWSWNLVDDIIDEFWRDVKGEL